MMPIPSHSTSRTSRRRRAATCLAVLGTVAALTVTTVPRTVAAPRSPAGPGTSDKLGSSRLERKGDYDARTATVKQQLAAAQKVPAGKRAAGRTLGRQLGTQGVQELDPATGTPAMVGRLDGFLTGRSTAKPATIVLRYVRAHLAAFGLTAADLDTLHLTRQYVDVAGISHLSWTQSADGITLFGNGLKANVTKRGELISISGSPVSGLASLAARTGSTARVGAAAARTRAAADVGGSVAIAKATTDQAGRRVRWGNDDRAQLVWFLTGRGLRLGWSTYVQAGGDTLNYQHVIDADSGSVLYRHDTVDSDRDPRSEQRAEATGSRAAAAASSSSARGQALVVDNYPGARRGGQQRVVDLIQRKYLTPNATTLSGAYVRAYADLDDDNSPGPGETVPVPGATTGTPQYPLVPFSSDPRCSSSFVCTWDPARTGSWAVNLPADVTQGFYFDSVFHDYLHAKPFGFTRAAGNFEARDGDEVQLNSLDGASTDHGMPDGAHIDNANMATPPDGLPPRMQMYLFHAPGATPEQDPSLPTSSSFDASIIFHEYTHGLSNRLVVDATGNSTLRSIQAGSMGEAWSDFYAEDYLVTKGYERDTSTPGDALLGKYVVAGQPFRTMGIDCPVTTTSTNCTSPSGETGGYTYGDFSTIIGTPEVHASGEIWGQTLWDLRRRLGHQVTGMVVTRAMELSPADPSFLDMRNAILQADLAVYGGRHRNAIWRVFANRGMGFFAGSTGAGDSAPAQDFSMPPGKGTPKATVSGTVLDGLTGRPVARALVAISGHASGFGGDYSALTDAAGRYAIPGVLVGTYPKVVVTGPGYEVLTRQLAVVPRGTRADFRPRRDWAAASGGGRIADFDGPDLSPACGPQGAIDLSLGSGWGSTTGDDRGTPTNVMIPKSIVVELPAPITLSSFAVDPSNTCGDPRSSSTGQYRIETSANATSWSPAAAGTFTGADIGRLNAVPVAAPVADVRYVRFTMLSPQVPDFATNCPEGAYGGCTFTDMTELEVFGTR